MVRLTTIFTKQGDGGSTSLATGERLEKNDARFEVMGNLDELNSILGIIISLSPAKPISRALQKIQHQLFDLGADFASKHLNGQAHILPKQITELETIIEKINSKVGPLKNFILPGGSLEASFLHLARTVCRRAERCAVGMSQREVLPPLALPYLNRLSDALFMMARYQNYSAQINEIYWQQPNFDKKI